jgi:CheY-like chemotaxis protein
MANNGLVALEKLSEGSFDIVLMDIQMPEMDGLTAATQIRSDRRYDKLPVLAMTANAGPEHLEESMNAGMNEHLTKPINTEQLYNALIKWHKIKES